MSLAALNSDCLVLNRNYMAVRVISVKRAFSMLCRSIAEVVHADEENNFATYNFESWQEISKLRAEFKQDPDEWIRTVHFDLMVPRIIRLMWYDRLPRRQVKFNRRNIFARDRNRCQYCGKRFTTSELSLDHVVPRRSGGKATWENLVCCCLKCNIKKGGRTPEQAHMKLITRPVKPKRSPVIALQLSQSRYRSWKHFLDAAYWSVELTD
jgi:5-methylcytosine-specific restriction endonuclease McrA